ncbi:MAG: FeoA family protein [Burkholderiales bacterium]|nr:ferrous iron transport protein A [Sulfuricellaceae bacterium]
MTTKLSVLQPGDSGTIAGIHAEEELFHRLMALGFRVGKPLQLIRRAKFSGPLHVRLGTTDIILRANDARHIDINIPA